VLNIHLVIVCHCHGVSDRRIRREARRGVGCPDELAERCGAGSDCGGCVPLIEDLMLDMTPQETSVQLAS
jgi:bacterioferritin-associated ferredoxin